MSKQNYLYKVNERKTRLVCKPHELQLEDFEKIKDGTWDGYATEEHVNCLIREYGLHYAHGESGVSGLYIFKIHGDS